MTQHPSVAPYTDDKPPIHVYVVQRLENFYTRINASAHTTLLTYSVRDDHSVRKRVTDDLSPLTSPVKTTRNNITVNL
jgi:hypothetical protein